MRIAICIIYVYDDVDVSAYEYANLYVDGYVNVSVDRYMIMIIVIIYVYKYLYMYEPENEN